MGLDLVLERTDKPHEDPFLLTGVEGDPYKLRLSRSQFPAGALPLYLGAVGGYGSFRGKAAQGNPFIPGYIQDRLYHDATNKEMAQLADEIEAYVPPYKKWKDVVNAMDAILTRSRKDSQEIFNAREKVVNEWVPPAVLVKMLEEEEKLYGKWRTPENIRNKVIAENLSVSRALIDWLRYWSKRPVRMTANY